jgi:hypothetical protein
MSKERKTSRLGKKKITKIKTQKRRIKKLQELFLDWSRYDLVE